MPAAFLFGMKHFVASKFWAAYAVLPPQVRKLADRNFVLLKNHSRHPSLHFKRVGPYWSARIGAHYRALGIPDGDNVVWFWIGSHAEYDALIRS